MNNNMGANGHGNQQEGFSLPPSLATVFLGHVVSMQYQLFATVLYSSYVLNQANVLDQDARLNQQDSLQQDDAASGNTRG